MVDGKQWRNGGAEYVARNRLTVALEPVLQSLAKQMDRDRGLGAEHADYALSEPDLANVRARFVEWQAVSNANAGGDLSKHEPAYWRLALNGATLVYRLTVFAAALVILAR